MRKTFSLLFCSLTFVGFYPPAFSHAASYPDQHFIITGGDSLMSVAESLTNITLSADGKSICLVEGAVAGTITLRPQSSPQPWNLGLPSWNGTAPDDNGGFRVFIRVPYLAGWSPWLDIGYWKANLWPGGKTTAFSGGKIDIDIVQLDYYVSKWQFAIQFKRNSSTNASPSLQRLSLFASDSRSDQNIDYAAILNEKPAALFIPTTFLAQYRLSDEIGSRICSPTTVAMILKSYHINVDPLQFAWDTLDPYYDIFGVWPRVVQNGSEYGLRGYVTRYRTWGQAREVLAKGGRIGMSIGRPLYGGHLVMLAGFTANGDPIVHDPARSNDGYGHVFNKSDLSHSWFDKGGVAYTFFPEEENTSAPAWPVEPEPALASLLHLYQNHPNPFNGTTTFRYELEQSGEVEFFICDMRGRRIVTLAKGVQSSGTHELRWDGRDLTGLAVATGAYLYHLNFETGETKTGKLLWIK